MRGLQKAALAARVFPKRHVNGDASGGGHNARLPQAAADRLAHPPGLLDEGLGADDDAPDGRAEALGETQADGVEAGAEVGQGTGARRDDLPEPRAVAVHVDAVLAREGGDAPRLRERRDLAV